MSKTSFGLLNDVRLVVAPDARLAERADFRGDTQKRPYARRTEGIKSGDHPFQDSEDGIDLGKAAFIGGNLLGRSTHLSSGTPAAMKAAPVLDSIRAISRTLRSSGLHHALPPRKNGQPSTQA
jgi:hypothetical protein